MKISISLADQLWVHNPPMLANIMEVSVRRGSSVVILMSRGVAITWAGRSKPTNFWFDRSTVCQY